jgi:hypothetical protein
MFVDDLFDKKSLTEAQGGGSPWHSEPEQQQMDADRRGRLGRERNAGLDEPDDAVSGPAQTGNGVYEYTVPAGQESTAQELGLQQHRGHWFSRVPIQRANFQFGQPQFREIPSQGVAEAGNKPLEKSRFGTGDTRTPRDIKSQMSGASDEFVKSTAGQKTGPFHSKVAKMQGKMAKSELRRREQGVAEVKKNDKNDDHEPFNYDEWKASTVKPRKPRGDRKSVV